MTEKESKKEPINFEEKSRDLVEQLQRLQAEFINFRNRTEQEKAGLIEHGKEKAFEQILDLFENFERAKENIDKEGIKLICKQFNDILNNNKIQAISNEGKYNPELHEVVCKEGNDTEEDTITEVFQKGYTFNEKIMRPSKVKVSGGKQ